MCIGIGHQLVCLLSGTVETKWMIHVIVDRERQLSIGAIDR